MTNHILIDAGAFTSWLSNAAWPVDTPCFSSSVPALLLQGEINGHRPWHAYSRIYPPHTPTPTPALPLLPSRVFPLGYVHVLCLFRHRLAQSDLERDAGVDREPSSLVPRHIPERGQGVEGTVPRDGDARNEG